MSTEARSADHMAAFGVVTIFHNYLFDVGDGIDVADAAKRLLRSGIAETAAWPEDRELALSPRYRKLAETRGQALSMLAVQDFYDGLLKFRQLTVQARWLLVKIQLSALIRALRKFLPAAPDGAKRFENVRKKMEGVVEDIDNAMDELRFDPLIQCAVDRDLYRPGYLDSSPYVRLRLRRFQITPASAVNWRSNKSDGKVWVRVSMLLHRSGVAILSFETSIESGSCANDLIPLATGHRTKILGSKISEPVVRASAKWAKIRRGRVGGVLLDDEMEGTRWRAYDHLEKKVALTEIFAVYREGISQVLGRVQRSGGTLVYPVVFIESLECCGDRDTWMSRHESELTGIASASLGYDQFTGESRVRMLGDDQSHVIGSSTWVTNGRSIVVWWRFEEGDYSRARYRQTLSTVDNALLKFWQLHAIDYRLTTSATTLASVMDLQKRLVFGLDEVRQSQFSYGTAEDLSNKIFVELGGDELRSQLQGRSETYQQMISGRAASLASRRANRFALSAMIVAAILGLPAIRQSLDVLKAVGSNQSLLMLDRLKDASAAKLDTIAFWSYSAVLVVMLLVVVTTFEKVGGFSRRARNRAGKLGYRWPGKGFFVALKDRSSGEHED